MAIEHLSFGEGFLQGGPNWGVRARPFLQDPRWQRLLPGISMLHMEFDFGYKVTVDSDGRGIAELVGNTQQAASLLWRRNMERWGLPRSARPVDEGFRLMDLIIPAQKTPDIRLVGLLRFVAEPPGEL